MPTASARLRTPPAAPKRAAKAGRAATATRKPSKSARPVDGTRDRLVAAAAAEFAAHGFAGANVDRIARAARVNKAMIYYHFASKAALYREILGDMFRAVLVRVRGVADSVITPEEKLRGFIDAIAAEAKARPHFPPTWFREVAEGGTHLDAATIDDMGAILGTLAGIVREGVVSGRFRPVSPLLVHGGIVAPILLFFASDRLRKRIAKAGIRHASGVTPEDVVAHVHRVTLQLLSNAAPNLAEKGARS